MPAAARAGDLVPQIVHDTDAERAFDVPGTPYLMVLDELGIVRAKGTVNNLEQVEGLVDTAGRRMREERSDGRADDDGASATGARATDEPARVPRAGRARRGRARGRLAGRDGARSRPGRGAPHLRAHLHDGLVSASVRAAVADRPLRVPRPPDVRLSGRRPGRSSTATPATQERSKTCEERVPEVYAFVNNPRYGGGWTRCCSGRLRHIQDCCSRSSHPDQRRLRGPWLLPRRAQGVLHHVSRAHANVLSDGGLVALAAAAAVAGWSALWGP